MHASAYSISLAEKTRIRRMIDREWSQHLRPSENKVLTFLFSATIEWNKLADRFSVDRIANGFAKLCGTCLSDKTIRRCLDHLEAIGIIRRTRTPAGYRIAINIDWSPSMPLATPRAKKGYVEACRERAEMAKQLECLEGQLEGMDRAIVAMGGPKLAAPKGGQNDRSRPVKKTDAIEEGHTGQGQTLRPSAKASDYPGIMPRLVKSTEDMVRAGTAKAKEALRTRKPGNDSIARTWAHTYAEAFPDDAVPGLTRKDIGQAKLFLRFTTSRPGFKPMEVLEFCIREWRLIVSARFAWMTENGGAPSLPNIGFMLAFKDHFADAYNDRSRLRREMAMTGAERRLRRLVHNGMTQEEAAAEVAAKDSIATERAKIAEERAEINERMRAMEARENARQKAFILNRTPRVRANPVAPKGD